MSGPEQKPPRAGESKGRFRALMFLLVAIAAALGTAVLLTRYVETRIAAERVPTDKVVVAASDLTIATRLRPELMTVVDWPIASRPEGAVRDPAELDGKTVGAAITKGEAILKSKIAESGTGALSTLLAPGMRAIAVRVDDVVGVAGFVYPGDHVDVIVTMSPEGTSMPVSKIFLQNVKVLAVGKHLAKGARDPQGPVPATVATLMVTSEQAERLALAASRGQLLLALRSTIDQDVVATSGVAPRTLYGASLVAPAPAAVEKPREEKRPKVHKVASRPAPAAKPAPARTRAVEILRGDLYEKRDFTEKEPTP